MCTARSEKSTVSKGQQNGRHKSAPELDQFEKLFGFKVSDLRSIDCVVRLMCRPTDPSGLGAMRIIFGKLNDYKVFFVSSSYNIKYSNLYIFYCVEQFVK